MTLEALVKNGAELYAYVYFGAIIVVALLEAARPRRVPGSILAQRWFGNFSLTIIGTILIRVLFPVFGVGWAVFCTERGLGLLNQVTWPWWLELALTIVVIDFTLYVQHYLLHRVPVLWRLHRTHHSDHEFDFTTGVRFHPFEAVYSTTVLLGTIVALGPPPGAVLVSQLLTVAVAFAGHANLRIPVSVDRVARLLVVTPDMHRIHHSQDVGEGNSNFSNTLPWWDHLFGTYVDQPAAGHDGIVFGVAELSERKHQTLPWMLAQPFLSLKGQPELGSTGSGRAATAATAGTPRHDS